MVDYLLSQSIKVDQNEYGAGGHVQIQLADLWTVLMSGFESVWPKHRVSIAGRHMGDVWKCDLLKDAVGEGADLVPFHKLTMWLCYSIVEVLEQHGGWEVVGKEALCGLPEYRE